MTENPARTERAPYPVRVDATLDAPLSRGLWLVKWVLAIPHYVVLAFLWIAFVVLSVVAFFAILFTGRYPRAIFDFNVGVMRWSWRVMYYGYGALGTDRYPPFTLADVPDYPAHLEVAYPERLSRGLVLVKWWLLAIPHYLIVALFVGGGIWLSSGDWNGDGRWDDPWGFGGLVALLVLVAGVVLLFSGRYPQPIYDFVLGMDRWALRVAAYAGLMTDAYPPFRLDLGGTDPGSVPAAPPPAPVAPPAAPAPAGPSSPGQSRWTAGRVVAVVMGALLLVTSTGLLAAGGTATWAHTTLRDDGGYVWSPDARLDTPRSALITDSLRFDGAGLDWAVDNVLGTARLQARADDGDTPIFLGIGRTADVTRYLAGVGHERLGDLGVQWGPWHLGPGRHVDHAGGAPSVPPERAGIWAAQASGTGLQQLQWRPAEGDWTAVIMRADGQPGVSVEARVGATLPGLGWLIVNLFVFGGLFLVAGVLLIVLAVRRAQQAPPAGAVPATRAPDPVPVGTDAGAPR